MSPKIQEEKLEAVFETTLKFRLVVLFTIFKIRTSFIVPDSIVLHDYSSAIIEKKLAVSTPECYRSTRKKRTKSFSGVLSC